MSSRNNTRICVPWSHQESPEVLCRQMWKPEDNSKAFLSPRGKHSSIITVEAMYNINCKQCFIRVPEIFTGLRGPRCRVYFSPQTVFVIQLLQQEGLNEALLQTFVVANQIIRSKSRNTVVTNKNWFTVDYYTAFLYCIMFNSSRWLYISSIKSHQA